MPTERFDRLPPDKKKAILQAAVVEFSRVPFEKVSINKIIKNADISRGSFYTYFEDKRDLLQFVFKDFIERAEALCKECLEKNQGNFWKMLEDLGRMIEEGMQKEWKDNLLDMIRIAMFQANVEEILEQCNRADAVDAPQTFENWIYEHGDWRELKSQDQEFVRITVALGIQTLMSVIGQSFKEPERTEELYRLYTKKIEILRYGACVSKMPSAGTSGQ